ncbi:MAG: hypothetical protein FWF87_01460 [Synergistaceae bacterium]|nr:hypothetical protein [Synergistaceae bacterium]
MTSTIPYENGFPPDVKEIQFTHAEGNKTRAAYNHAEYMTECRKIIQCWADWLDRV